MVAQKAFDFERPLLRDNVSMPVTSLCTSSIKLNTPMSRIIEIPVLRENAAWINILLNSSSRSY